MSYRLWVNEERTVLVRLWSNGQMEVAERPSSECTWGPPIRMEEEQVAESLTHAGSPLS